MTNNFYERRDFDRQVSLSEAASHHANVAANDAFIAKLGRAVIKGKEKAVPGTFIDTTPPIHARKIRGSFPISACGSPAAMCAETGARGDGAQTLR